MSVANITQYQKRSTSIDLMQIPTEPSISSENVTYTASAQSAVFDADCNLVRILLDAIGYVLFATNPTALATSTKLLANEVYWFEVEAGTSLKVAIYDGTT